jgi:glycosyltransferase involved in cell wall biosynthesis
MRIAYDHQIFGMQSYGGISRYFSKLAQEMVKLGEDIRIISPFYRNKYLSDFSSNVVRGHFIENFPHKTAGLFCDINRFGARLHMNVWKPDIVHETYYSPSATFQRGCAVVVTVYDMVHELFPDNYLPNDSTAQAKRLAVIRADHVFCISENTKRDLIALHDVKASKVTVVHLGFDSPQCEYLSDYSPPCSRPYLLYVGLRSGYKNFLGLLNEVAKSERLLADFDIVAFGGGSFSDGEKKVIHELGYQANQVIQIGGSDDLLWSVYRSARAFIYPSLYEGFGIPPLEAMSQNCPVISSNTSSMPEVIGNAAEYFDPNNINDMRWSIEKVVYSDSIISDLKSAGKIKLKAFSWSKCASETIDIYRSLL